MKLINIMDDLLAGRKARRAFFARGTFCKFHDGSLKYFGTNDSYVPVIMEKDIFSCNDWELIPEDCKHCGGTGEEPNKDPNKDPFCNNLIKSYKCMGWPNCLNYSCNLNLARQ